METLYLKSSGGFELQGETIQDVTWFDNQAPTSPDGTGGHQSRVLGQGKLLSRAVEVGDTGDDQGPL